MQGKLTVLKNASGETVFPVTSSEAVISSDGATTLEQKINTVGDKTVILNQEVENAKSLMAQKINFTVDSTSNVEIPQIDEKLNSINNKYETVASQLEHIVNLIKGSIKTSLENVQDSTNVKIAKGNYTLNGDIIYINNKHNITLDLSDAVINQTYHGYGVIEFNNCSDIIIKGGKLIGSGNFPSQTVTSTEVINEKTSTIAEWGFHKNNDVTSQAIYNNGRYGNVSFGILINSGCENIVIDGVEASYFNYVGIGVGFLGNQTTYNKNVTIKNCYCHHNFDAGIQYMNVNGFVDFNNTVENNGHPSATVNDVDCNPGYGVTCRGANNYAINGEISNLKSNNNKRKGIDIHSGKNILVDGNNINNCWLNGISATLSNNTLVSNITIKDNTIENCALLQNGSNAIYGYANDWVDIKGNKIINSGLGQIDSNGIAIIGSGAVDSNLLINSGYGKDIYAKCKTVSIKNNKVIDETNNNQNKISIFAWSPESDLSKTLLELDGNYINVKNGFGLNFQNFQNGYVSKNTIFAPYQVKGVTTVDYPNVIIHSDNNFKREVDKIQTNSYPNTNTLSFILNISSTGVISHNANSNIISSITDSDRGVNINFVNELDVRGVSFTNKSSNNLPYLNNVYIRNTTNKQINIGLGNTSDSLGKPASQITQSISLYINIIYS